MGKQGGWGTFNLSTPRGEGGQVLTKFHSIAQLHTFLFIMQHLQCKTSPNKNLRICSFVFVGGPMEEQFSCASVQNN